MRKSLLCGCEYDDQLIITRCSTHYGANVSGIGIIIPALEAERDRLQAEIGGLKEMLMKAGAGVGIALEGAQDAVKEHRDQVAELALENGRLRAQIERLKQEKS